MTAGLLLSAPGASGTTVDSPVPFLLAAPDGTTGEHPAGRTGIPSPGGPGGSD
jgi:hypothetical protein